MEYKDKLRNPKWQKKRLEILNRDNFTCFLCGDQETELHVHHTEYKGNPWDIDNEKLKTVCKHCHLILHEVNNTKLRNVVKDMKSYGDISVFFAIFKDESVFSYLYSDENGIESNGVFFKKNISFLFKNINL